MRPLRSRMLFFVLSVACIAGCSSGEKPVAMISSSETLTVDEAFVDGIADAEDHAMEAVTSEEVLPEKPVAEAAAIDELEIELREPDVVAVSDSEEMEVDTAPDIDASEPTIDDDQVEPVVEQTDQQPLLTKELIDAFVQLEQKRNDADKLLFKHIANMASAYDLRKPPADIYEYIVAQIDVLNEYETGHETKINFPVPIDMKIGRPTAGHRVRGTSLPSMRLVLLKYLIDRSRDSDDFEIDAWLDRTREIEKKLANAVEPVFETFPFLELLKQIEDATDMWAYTNYRVQENDSILKYGFSVSPAGRIVFENHGGILGRATRMGTRAALAHNLEKLDNYRKDFEWARLDMDLVMGDSLNGALSDSDRTHLEHLWEAKVLLSPKYFYRIRWQSQYSTDFIILKAGNAISRAKDKATADLYIERAKLFSLKGSQPYMFYSDLSKASDLDPELKLDSEMQQQLDAVIKVLELEDRAYTASARKELYFDSLRLVDHE